MGSRHADANLIDAMGGPAAVARALGYDTTTGGTQRVQNWKRRGIPALLKYQRADLFAPKARKRTAGNRKSIKRNN